MTHLSAGNSLNRVRHLLTKDGRLPLTTGKNVTSSVVDQKRQIARSALLHSSFAPMEIVMNKWFVLCFVMTSSVVSIVDAGDFRRQADGSVVYVHGGLRATAYPWYGGQMLRWQVNGKDICNPFAGEGALHVTLETGNDANGSMNGLDAFEIARLDKVGTQYNEYHSYYGRELTLTKAKYVTEAYMPFYLDNQYPDLIEAKGSENLWQKLDNQMGRPAWEYSFFGTPIWFAAQPGRTAGIIGIGDEVTQGSLLRFMEGRMAFKTTISLRETQTGFGGIMFRKQVEKKSGPTNDDIYNAPGYGLYVNKLGEVQLHGLKGLIWGSGANPDYARMVNGDGIKLEIRTHNAIAVFQEIWINERKVFTVGPDDDLSPFTGEHVAFFASSEPGGLVRFSHREFFDVSVETRTTWTANSDGSLNSEIDVHKASFVGNPIQLYRVNQVSFGQAFLPSKGGMNLSWTRIKKQPWRSSEFSVPPLFLNAKTPNSFYYGTMDGKHGINCRPVLAEIDGKPSPGAHALIATDGSRAMLHLNALSFEHNTNPVRCNRVRLISKWSPGLTN